MEIAQSELDVSSILRYISIVFEVVGGKWLQKKTTKAKNLLKPKKLKKFKHALEPQPIQHSLVDWFLEYDRWRLEALKTKRMPLYPNIIKLSLLGKHLEKTRYQKGFDKLLARLKDSAAFGSAAFEVEVAASYVEKNWEVEFIEEGTEKTPDLKITRPDGSFFWVECKQKDVLTKRDRNIQLTWRELETTLLNYLGPKKLNYLIAVNAKRDPERRDVEYLRLVILEAIESQEISDPKSNKIFSLTDQSGFFEILLQKLSAPDEVKKGAIGFETVENFDRVYLGIEAMKNESGEIFSRNPIVIALMTDNPPDRVTVTVNLLKAAVAQLPESDPGVVWIRIPDSSWEPNLNESFERIKKLLRKELTGEMNRRVNAVFVMTRIFKQVEKNALQVLAYKPLIMRVIHDNPKSKKPLTKSNA